MYAMLTDERGNFKCTQVPEPVLEKGKTLIKVHACGLNRADLLQRAGKYPPPPGWPHWMGLELSGEVAESLPGSRWKRGDKVCALLGGGAYAEMVLVPEDLIMPVPRGLPMPEAAGLPEVFATAYLNLCLEAGIKPGDTVLIHAGASGLGIATIQLAKIFGAKTIATVGSDAKAAAVREIGADIVVNRKKEDLSKVLDENPPDIALDCVGGAELGKNIEKLANGGRWILIATLGGERSEISLRPFLKRGLRLIGSTLRSRSNETKGLILRELVRKVWPEIEAGRLRPSLYRTLPMAEAELAHSILEKNENIGKVILSIVKED